MTAAETLLADLECVVQELSDRVAALTQAVDALMDEIQWRNNHVRDAGETPEPSLDRECRTDCQTVRRHCWNSRSLLDTLSLPNVAPRLSPPCHL